MSVKKTATKTVRAAPQRPCPQCGVLIHAKKSSHECGWVKEKPATAPMTVEEKSSTGEAPTINKDAFIRLLAHKGFKFVRMINDLTGEVIKEETDAKIDKLNLQFKAIPKNAKEIHIIQTSPQPQVAMSLDKFLELAGIKP